MATVRINTNEPLETRLRSLGEVAPSNFGPDQVRYATDAGTLYVSEAVGKIFAAAIEQQGIQIGDLVVIAKREVANGARKTIRWSLESRALPKFPPAEVLHGDGTLSVPRIAAVPVAAPAARIEPQRAETAISPAVLVKQANLLYDAYQLALDQARANYGAAVRPEDIRAFITTAYIQAAQNGGRINAA